MTPLQVKILIHYALAPGLDYGPWSKQVEEECHNFCLAGILFLNETGREYPKYTGNMEALTVYLNAVTNIPIPQKKWVMPDPKTDAGVEKKWMIPNS